MLCFKQFWKQLFFICFTCYYSAFSQCKQQYSWANWSNFNGKSATGNILVNGKQVSVTMTANYDFSSTSVIYGFNNFSQFSGVSAIPNATVPRTEWSAGVGGKTTMCFSEPVTNPILLVASLGGVYATSPPVPVSLSLDQPYVVLYDGGGMKFNSSYTITGTEGNAILLFPGTFTCLTIFSDTPEFYTNITWGLQPPIFPIDIKIKEDETKCGSITLTASGGNTYQWSGGRTQNSATNTFDVSGAYSVTATDKDGCTAVALRKVVVPPKSTDTTIYKNICQGETFEGYKTSGVYKDTFKSVYGCDSIRTLNLNVLGLPKIAFNNRTEVCNGTPLEIAPTITPTNLPVNYRWSTGATGTKIIVTQPDTYSLIVTNGTCSAKDSTKVVAGQPPSLKPNENICLSTNSIQLESGATGSGLKYLWTPSNSTNSTLSISQIGTYQVKVSTEAGCEASRTLNVLLSPQVELGADKILCEGESTDLTPTNTNSGTVSYNWSTGETIRTLKANKTGVYRLTVTQNSCSATDSVKVTVNPLPTVLADETTCSDNPLIASNPDNNLTYLWEHSGEKTREVTVRDDGVYKVKVTNQFGCSKTRTITVNGPCNTRIFAPDIFTPNGDSTNDIFKVLMLGGTQLRLDVYNRWGTPIYSEEGANPQWDGKVKGEACQNGYYPYILKYKSINNDTVYEFRGSVLLER